MKCYLFLSISFMVLLFAFRVVPSIRCKQGRTGEGRPRARQGRAGQGRARARQGKARQGKAGQGKAGQGRAGQGGKARQGKARQGKARSAHTNTNGAQNDNKNITRHPKKTQLNVNT